MKVSKNRVSLKVIGVELDENLMRVPPRDCLLLRCPILVNICRIGPSRGTSMVKRRSEDIQQLPLTKISLSLLFRPCVLPEGQHSPSITRLGISGCTKPQQKQRYVFSLYQCFSEISTSFTSTPSLNQRSESASLTSLPLICLFLIRPSSAKVQSSRP
jgi:hypothetical protein